jgi:hypothetical protein
MSRVFPDPLNESKSELGEIRELHVIHNATVCSQINERLDECQPRLCVVVVLRTSPEEQINPVYDLYSATWPVYSGHTVNI